MPTRTLIVILVALTALSGCGRRAGLDPPGAEPAATAQTTNVSPLDPGAPAAAAQPQAEPIPPPKRFFLDFLL